MIAQRGVSHISGLISKIYFSKLGIFSHLQMTFAIRLGIHSQAGYGFYVNTIRDFQEINYPD